ncbi:cytochrome P450 [Mycena vulgaris]|nr:cytochrome P450 [Mycena vulgaris]
MSGRVEITEHRSPASGPRDSPAIVTGPYRAFVYIGTMRFFVDPPSFFSACMTWSKGRMFSFKILSDTVIVVRGLAGRDIFLAKGLDFLAGYKLLNPQLKEFLPKTPIRGDRSWGAVVASFIRTGMIEKVYSTMLKAIASGYETWGDDGILDLFRSVNEIVFAVTLPLAGCQCYASDPKAVKALVDIFARLDEGSTPSSLILAWVPTPARVRRLLAGIQLYRMTKSLVEEQKLLGVDEDGPLQDLIKQGYPVSELARFIATIIFASVANTANIFAWTLVYLEQHTEWKERVLSEANAFLHDTGLYGSGNLPVDMADVSLELMDAKMPTIELVINEILRLHASGPFIRRNIGDNLTMDSTHIQNGAFIMFPAIDLHRNPDIFPDPDIFDPARFTAEQLDRRKHYGTTFIGWGAGRHACVGKRAALLQVKMIAILLVAKYDFALVDHAGLPLRVIPNVKVDKLFKICGPDEPVHIQYRTRDRHG